MATLILSRFPVLPRKFPHILVDYKSFFTLSFSIKNKDDAYEPNR